ncbi:MAG: ABC transporter permease [Janthinobacterium lividum]
MSVVDTTTTTAPFTVAPRRRGALGRQYASEIQLVFRRRRNLALLAALAVVPIVIGIAVDISTPRGGDGPQFLSQITGNGVFLVFTALTVTVPFFLPLVISVVAGDSIAGEAGGGTLRYLLTVPLSRSRLLAVKALGVATFTAAGIAVVALSSLATGGILFGLHAVTLLSGDTVSLGNGLFRALLIAVFVAIAMFGLAAAGVFMSSLTENPLAAMAATLAIAVASAVLDAVPQLSGIHPGLLTDHWLDFGELLRTSPDPGTLLRATGVHLAYVVVLGAAAWARLVSKDITS